MALNPESGNFGPGESTNQKARPWVSRSVQESKGRKTSNSTMVAKMKDERTWDFVLPTLISSYGYPWQSYSLSESEYHVGNTSIIEELAATLKHGTLSEVESMMVKCQADISPRINNCVEGFPAIFYAVQSNDAHIVRLFVAHGAKVSALHEPSGTPLLAFAIVHSQFLSTDTTNMVSTLLSLGASHDVIPTAFYQSFCEDMPEKGPPQVDIKDVNKKWCTKQCQLELTKTINLSQRYYLDRASKLREQTARERQVLRITNAEALLCVPYFVAGQRFAFEAVLRNVMRHNIQDAKQPLVMMFAGPSGHGKTKLARQMGDLLSLKLSVVDCTTFAYEHQLFGGRAPFKDSEKGSVLNNFLVANSGKRSIVFLDEFEKTTEEIHHALLLPFESGKSGAERPHLYFTPKVEAKYHRQLPRSSIFEQRGLFEDHMDSGFQCCRQDNHRLLCRQQRCFGCRGRQE